MPKKFKGENSKAAEAKARKTAQKDADDQRKQQQLEDEYWKDDDKHLQKKLQRKVRNVASSESFTTLFRSTLVVGLLLYQGALG